MENFELFCMDQYNIIFKHNSGLKIKCDNYIKNGHQFQYTIEDFNFEIFQKYCPLENNEYILCNNLLFDKSSEQKRYHKLLLFGNNFSLSKKIIIDLDHISTCNQLKYKSINISTFNFNKNGCILNDNELFKCLQSNELHENFKIFKEYLLKYNTDFIIDAYMNQNINKSYKLFKNEELEEYIEI